jgi:hypothetical protein
MSRLDVFPSTALVEEVADLRTQIDSIDRRIATAARRKAISRCLRNTPRLREAVRRLKRS